MRLIHGTDCVTVAVARKPFVDMRAPWCVCVCVRGWASSLVRMGNVWGGDARGYMSTRRLDRIRLGSCALCAAALFLVNRG